MATWPYNYHAHTTYGDGRSTAAEQVAAAIRAGMRQLGLSEHASLGDDVRWTVPIAKLSKYRAELLALRELAGSRLDLRIGLEVDWRPARDEWWGRIEGPTWDYRLGSVHFIDQGSDYWAIDSSEEGFQSGIRQLFGGDVRAACEQFYAAECAAALSGRFDILGHCDLVKKFNGDRLFFDDRESWYREMASTVVEAARQSNIIVEVNTAGLDKPAREFYPAPWLVERFVERGVRLTLNGDSHHSTELQRHFDLVLPQLAALGVRELWVLVDGEWRPTPIAE